MKYSSVLIICLLSVLLVRAQALQEDVVYLINGSVIRGELLSEATADPVSIRVMGGSVWVFQQQEVLRITREEVTWTPVSAMKAPRQAMREKGFYNISTIGLPVGSSISNNYWGYGGTYTAVGLSLHNVTGYRWSRWLGTGLGIGMDVYGSSVSPVSPVYLRMETTPLVRSTHPFGFLDVGYGFRWIEPANEYVDEKGGIFWQAGAGIRFQTRGDVYWQLSAGYLQQRLYSFESYPVDWGAPQRERIMTLRRMVFSVGIGF
jgi:hypothetical protein